MQLIIDNKIIDTDIKIIVETLRNELNYNYFHDIILDRDNIRVTCPFHSEGHEKHPSCYIYNADDNDKVEKGFVHCFTCGAKMPLYSMVSKLLNLSEQGGKDWLTGRFSSYLSYSAIDYLPEIDLKEKPKTYLDESILNEYAYYHPYMWQRKLTKEVVDRFKIGYDRRLDAITFPTYDEHNHLVMVTKRSTKSKRFYIDSNVEKPVYLLNFMLQAGITQCFVMESQINALVANGWGYPSIALFGTGSSKQYDILKKSGIRHFILCFDGDDAGRKGAKRFISNMNDDIFITDVQMYPGKDVADLSREQFEILLHDQGVL